MGETFYKPIGSDNVDGSCSKLNRVTKDVFFLLLIQWHTQLFGRILVTIPIENVGVP